MRRSYLYFSAYIATIFMANLAITLFGIVPIGFGLMAPAGVLFAGLALTLRDLLQDTAGRWWVVVAILVGAALSSALGGSLALASGVAFLISEFADFAVYTPLKQRSWLGAIVLSNTVGAVVDSALFLWLAFGSLDFLPGQVLAKTYVTLIAVAVIVAARRISTRLTKPNYQIL